MLGLSGPADPAGLPLLAVVVTAAGLLTTPLVAAWSRRLEREADRVALDVSGAPDAFVAAMERLGRLNLAERRPGRLRELLFATHPSLEARIAAGRAAGARLGAAALMRASTPAALTPRRGAWEAAPRGARSAPPARPSRPGGSR